MTKTTAARAIPGYAGYEITPDGRVFSHRQGFREMTPHLNRDGYLGLRLSRDDGSRPYVFIHQLILLAFIAPRPSASHVGRHLNGDATDNRADNLAWGTTRENVADMIRHGTAAFLAQNGDDSPSPQAL